MADFTDILGRIQSQSFKRLIAAVWNEVPEVIKFLQNDYGINPVIIGGLAVQHHGLTRMTEDLDLLISKLDYDKLVAEGKIKFGALKWKPGFQVDMVWEGRDGNPNPESVRDGSSVFPTLQGLICLKLISGRMKDQSDVVELIKIHNFDPGVKSDVLASDLLDTNRRDLFNRLWGVADEETNKEDK